ncbi:MAG: Sapep family Mn(2+)-dependent dipeptidase [Oscillospiraceae bacterium]|nr:Sapep family Mn(2+)-dependent dipeptidase [Oscillospiraceae bacterium]
MYKKQLEEYFAAHQQEMIDDICALMRIPSDRQEPKEGMPFGEGPAKALEKAMEIGQRMGMKVTDYDHYVATFDINDGPRGLDILAHLDIVPVGDDWTVTKPFEPKIVDGKLYGRGSADDKGPAMAGLWAAKAVKDLGIPLSKNCRVILGTDEESGSSDIKHYYAIEEEAPATFSPDADFPVINVEKGSYSSHFVASWEEDRALPRILSVDGGFRGNVVPDKATAVMEGIALNEVKAICDAYNKECNVQFTAEEKDGTIVVSAAGQAAHAAMPEGGANAVTAMLELLSKMPMAPSAGFEKLCGVSRIFPHGDWAGEAAGVKMSDDISGPLTISFTIFKYDGKSLDGVFDSRCSLCATNENMRDVLIEKFGAYGIELTKKEMRPGHHVPAESPFVQTLLRCYEDYTGKEGRCIAIGGGTYTHNLKNGVAFGCADLEVDNHMHGADEFAVIDQLVMSAKIFAQVIIEMCK